jgi:methylenetetrahydrofolate dehydrogenase (NADP+)/methenyltetrahydrofolate cyclohydrolase
MAAKILSGREVSSVIITALAQRVASLHFVPRLVFVRAGDDPASASYVRSKSRLAVRAGIDAETVILDSDTTQQQLLNTVFGLNQDVNVDGILIQLPLYEQLSSEEVLEAVDPSKDVDGFHPRNVGRLWSGEPGLVPATPLGLIRILDHFCIPIEGQHVVIIGRSNLVGKPAAALFLHRHATVTLAHSKTRDLPLLTRQADILVAGAGRAGIVTKEWVKDGATILDVGQSLVGGNILGDVDPAVAEVAAAMTPTPGGTGPMTVAMVIHNTVEAARSRRAAID